MELENTGPVGPSIVDDYPREDFGDFFEVRKSSSFWKIGKKIEWFLPAGGVNKIIDR